MNLPFQNPRAGGGSFGLWNVSCRLQRDGKRGVGQRVSGSDSRERQRRADRLLQPAGVPQCADEPVVRFEMSRIGLDGSTKCLGRAGWLAGSQQRHSIFKERICGGVVRCGHGSL